MGPTNRVDSETARDPEKSPAKWWTPVRAEPDPLHLHKLQAAARDLESTLRDPAHWTCEYSGQFCFHQVRPPSSWRHAEAVNASARQPFERGLCEFQAGLHPKKFLR